MMRDPVCGTFVVQSRARSATRGGEQAYFCSDDCRRAWLSGAHSESEPGPRAAAPNGRIRRAFIRSSPVPPSEASVRADICEVGRRLYARGYVASNDGNISVRLDATES